MTIKVPSVLLKGLEYVHIIDPPREESQAGLTTVSPTHDVTKISSEYRIKNIPLINTRVVLMTS